MGDPRPALHESHPTLHPHPHPQGFRLLLSTGGGYDADVAPFLAEFGRDVRDYVALALGVTPPSASATPGNEPGSTVFVRRWEHTGERGKGVREGKEVFLCARPANSHTQI